MLGPFYERLGQLANKAGHSGWPVIACRISPKDAPLAHREKPRPFDKGTIRMFHTRRKKNRPNRLVAVHHVSSSRLHYSSSKKSLSIFLCSKTSTVTTPFPSSIISSESWEP